jgi:hypothetical protein
VVQSRAVRFQTYANSMSEVKCFGANLELSTALSIVLWIMVTITRL